MNRVLVVEDEQHLADGLRFNLEAEGYRVEVVETGEEALEQLLAQPAPFDVLVLDVMLPGKDGFTVMSEMRQAGQFIPTLMLTARGHPDDVLRGFAAGADDYLTKPFESVYSDCAYSRVCCGGAIGCRVLRIMPVSRAEIKDVFTFGEKNDKTVNFDLLEICVRDQVFPLTLMEANLLRYLIQHEGKWFRARPCSKKSGALHENTDTRANR